MWEVNDQRIGQSGSISGCDLAMRARAQWSTFPRPSLSPFGKARPGQRRPPKCDIPHNDHHQPLPPPPLGLLQAIESFVRIVREDLPNGLGMESPGGVTSWKVSISFRYVPSTLI